MSIDPFNVEFDPVAMRWMVWMLALWSFDRGHREHLAGLIESGEPPPPEFRTPVANVIRGKREPNAKAVVKFAGDPVALGEAACKMVWYRAREAEIRKHATKIADTARVEPAEVVRASYSRMSKIKRRLAADVGVEVQTLETAERSMARFAKGLVPR